MMKKKTRMKWMMAMPALSLVFAPALPAQAPDARPEDVTSPEAVVAAAYDAISRAPGENFDWERFKSLHLPDARLVPATEQTGGEFRVLTVDEFSSWIDGWQAQSAPIGSEADEGFFERQIHGITHRYGDIAQVLSTYGKGVHGGETTPIGINSFQLVHNDGRWWIVSIIWDEIPGAGEIPQEYMP